ncbi:helix-turn-helix transcriptional regulator [Rhizobium sp. NZLR11]|uniref:helix-turn-helix transcriptional regulator n=1 Tax=Rhizobium sp. NZLR11 TaxID=2731098 RepID=UPI001C82C0F1|nr:helix-turn-helix transcriptional regulator [Rhizobium sp. NZLR11]MBX5206722.1 helix-turn-helix transcriptional regulator [Rhizobium sp. NZLR11]
MNNVTEIHAGKENKRIHYIVEWAEKRQLSQADIVREIGADKSLVSRWFSGTNPGKEWRPKLEALFGADEGGLYRHPDDDWLARFFRDKTAEERRKAVELLEMFFRTG